MANILSIEQTVLPIHAPRSVHLAALSRAIAGKYVISGGYVQQHASVADMSVDVDAIVYRYGGAANTLSDATLDTLDSVGEAALDGDEAETIAAATVVVEAADEELHRIDILYIDASGNLVITKGTEGEAVANSYGSTAIADWLTWTSPSPPDMSSTPGVILAEILVPAGKTQIIDDYIRMLGQPGIGVTGKAGVAGADGATILSGADDPTTEGNDGDWYIQTTDWEIWGPKAAGAWPETGTPISIPGDAGTSILYGTVDPTTEGNNGDWYIQTTDWEIFGPKADDAWPASGVSLIGPTGPAYSPDHDLLTNLGHDGHPQYVLRSLLTEQGCIPFRGATVWEKLGPGVAGQILMFMGTGASPILANPIWQNYAPNASFERWTTGLLDGGWVQDSGSTVEIVDGAFDGYDGMFGVKITSAGSGAEGINVALTRLKPSTTYYVRVWMKPTEGDTAAAWTVGAATELDISSVESDGEFVTGSFVTGATPADIIIHLGQETSGDIAEYDMLTVTEQPAPMYISSEHSYTHRVGGRDEISHSRIADLLEDTHPQYQLLNGRSLGQVICGGTDASESLTLTSTYNATKGMIYLGANSVYDEVNSRLGIGVVPESPLDVLQECVIRRYVSSAVPAYLIGKCARGSVSSPTATLSGDPIFRIRAMGYGATKFPALGAIIDCLAAETFTDTAAGVHLRFWTTPIGSLTEVERMRITSAGYVGIGTASPTSPLHVVGNAYFSADVSALTFTDRSPAFLGDALAAVEQIRADENGDIDHASLPEFAGMPYQDENGEWWPGRSLGDMISMIVTWAQQFRAKTESEIATRDAQIATLEARIAAIEQRLAA